MFIVELMLRVLMFIVDLMLRVQVSSDDSPPTTDFGIQVIPETSNKSFMTESPSIAHAAIQTKINYRSIGIMCQPNLNTKSTQTIPYPSPYSKSTNTDDLVPFGPPPEAEENLNDSILTHSDKAELDESYAPSGTEYETDTTCDARFDDSEENEDTEDEKQFLTFWSVLAPLFVFC